ncbi:CHAT domain-containing protein [Flavimobilis sp. GY10621]|uniref:CHAT domain-containing protein n=1 Tax=Flavimobilis rhizosphaerae TaxID=2775421 RepID=A0ABR9DPD5_9MICO|nr:CHAT domain-containing protein [Flavimobilis rhizosphaerae]MBD9698774.1 CHAT domain-containing protein [Flavimobilis rhizosphaerae]
MQPSEERVAAAEALHARANDCSDRGRPEEARALLSEALLLFGEPEDPGDVPDQDVARAPGAARVTARILISLAAQGDELAPDESLSERRLARALALAMSSGSHDVALTVHGQRGLRALRAGDAERALVHLDAGVALLEHATPRDAGILLLNRGTLHLDRGALDAAVDDLAQCAQGAEAVGDAMLVFKARHNLGYAEFLAGRLPEALDAMQNAAEHLLPVLGEDLSTMPIALLDRAQVLFEVGLLTEADALLEQAAQSFEGRGLTQDLGEVEVLRARCARLLGRLADARALARAARERFGERGSATWVERARLVELRARLDLAADDDEGRAELRAVRDAALELAGPADGRQQARVAALVVGAEAHARLGEDAQARDLVARAARSRWGGAIDVRTSIAVVRARCAFAAGDLAAGVRAVVAGQRALAEHRARFGSVEALVASGVFGERLAELDIAAAASTGDAHRVLDAAERARTLLAGLTSVRLAPGAERLAVELRRASEELRLAEPVADHAQVSRLHARTIELREQLRAEGWRTTGAGEIPAATRAADVVRALQHGAESLVEIVVVDDTLLATVVDEAGARLVTLAEAAPVIEASHRLRADLRVLARPGLPTAMRTVVEASVARQARRIDELLVMPLDVPGPLHVVGPAWCVTVPWAVLPSRRGVPTSAGPRVDLTGPGPGRPWGDGVVVVAGPDLVDGEREAAEVAERWPGAELLVGRDATCGAVTEALRSADIVHLAAHGVHVADNPLFSSVRLVDGPLLAHEIASAPVTARTVVLAACEVGAATERAGGLPLGLASVLLGLGARHVVASVALVGDGEARSTMTRLHEELVAPGAGVVPALARATAASQLSPFVALTTSIGN